MLPKIDEFKSRILDKIYPMIFINEIRLKSCQDGISKEVSIYIVLNYNLEGIKEMLGFYISKSETSKLKRNPKKIKLKNII